MGIREIAEGFQKGSISLWELLGGLLLGIWKDMGMEGSRKGASLFAEALLGGLLLGIWKEMGRRAQWGDIIPQYYGGLFTGNLSVS